MKTVPLDPVVPMLPCLMSDLTLSGRFRGGISCLVSLVWETSCALESVDRELSPLLEKRCNQCHHLEKWRGGFETTCQVAHGIIA